MTPPTRVKHDTDVAFEACILKRSEGVLLRSGELVTTTRLTWELICYFVERAGETVSREELQARLWPGVFVARGAIDQAIWRVRASLGDEARHPRYVRTIPGRGWKFIAQPRSVGHKRREFVGRVKELRTLRRAYEQAGSGTPTFVWLSGPRGIGKTTLLERFIAQNNLGCVALVRSSEHLGPDRPMPMAPVVEAFWHLASTSHEARSGLREHAPSFSTWLDELEKEGGDAARSKLPPRLHETSTIVKELLGFVSHWSGDTPLVIAFDDLDQADCTTLGFLASLAKQKALAPLLIIGAWLPDYEARHSEFSFISSQSSDRQVCKARVLSLDPFTADETYDYVVLCRAPAPANEGLSNELFRMTGGDPLLVSLVLRSPLRCAIRLNGIRSSLPNAIDLDRRAQRAEHSV